MQLRLAAPGWKRALNRLDSSIRRFSSGESHAAFMAGLYAEMLVRPVDSVALSAGTRKLGQGLLRRSHLRGEIASSPEYRAASRARERERWLREGPLPATTRSLAASLPEEVWLELTTRCNIVPPCAMCGYAIDDVRPTRRDMDPRTWQALLPLLRQARSVGLHGAGEPLLYPFLGDLLAALRPSPAVVGFNSNGHLLTEDTSRRLVERGLGWISISLDAATAPTYLRIRRRSDFEPLLEKIKRLRETRDATGGPRPRIEINMTLMSLNLREAPAFVDLAARLRVDGVMFQEIQPGGSHRVASPDGFVFDYREQELAGDSLRDEVLGQARERARSLGLQFNCEILYGAPARAEAPGASGTADRSAAGPPNVACAEPWNRLLFNVLGDAFVCCVQSQNRVLLGRLPFDPPEEIWNGRRIRLVREAMFGGLAPSCCDGCYRMRTEPGRAWSADQNLSVSSPT